MAVFAFEKNADFGDDWNQIPGTGFGDQPLKTAVEFDTITQPLPPGRAKLGKLIVDVSNVDLSSGPATISLNVPGNHDRRAEGIRACDIRLLWSWI